MKEGGRNGRIGLVLCSRSPLTLARHRRTLHMVRHADELYQHVWLTRVLAWGLTKPEAGGVRLLGRVLQRRWTKGIEDKTDTTHV